MSSQSDIKKKKLGNAEWEINQSEDVGMFLDSQEKKNVFASQVYNIDKNKSFGTVTNQPLVRNWGDQSN